MYSKLQNPSCKKISIQDFDPTIRAWSVSFPAERRNLMLARTLLVGIAALNNDPNTVSHEWDSRESELQMPSSTSTLIEIDDNDLNDKESLMINKHGRKELESAYSVNPVLMKVVDMPAAGIRTTVKLVPRPGDPTSYLTYPSWWGHREHQPSHNPNSKSSRPLKSSTTSTTNNNISSVETITNMMVPQPIPPHSQALVSMVQSKQQHQDVKGSSTDPSIVNWSFPKKMVEEGTQTLSDAYVRPPSPVRKPMGWGREAIWVPGDSGVPNTASPYQLTPPSKEEMYQEDIHENKMMHFYDVDPTPSMRVPKPHTKDFRVSLSPLQKTLDVNTQTTPVCTSPLRKPPTSSNLFTSDMIRNKVVKENNMVLAENVAPPSISLKKQQSDLSRRSDSTGLKLSRSNGSEASKSIVKDNNTIDFLSSVSRSDNLEEDTPALDITAIEIAMQFMDSDFIKCLDMSALVDEEDEMDDNGHCI